MIVPPSLPLFSSGRRVFIVLATEIHQRQSVEQSVARVQRRHTPGVVAQSEIRWLGLRRSGQLHLLLGRAAGRHLQDTPERDGQRNRFGVAERGRGRSGRGLGGQEPVLHRQPKRNVERVEHAERH